MDTGLRSTGTIPAETWRSLDPLTAGTVALGSEMARLLDTVCRRTGSLTFSQYQLLGALRTSHPEPLEPWEIGRHIGSGSAQVTTLLDQLERSGLVVRAAHELDRRRRLVHLTAEGIRRVGEVARQVHAVERMVLDRALTADEAAAARLVVDRLRAVLSELLAVDLSFSLTADPGREPEHPA